MYGSCVERVNRARRLESRWVEQRCGSVVVRRPAANKNEGVIPEAIGFRNAPNISANPAVTVVLADAAPGYDVEKSDQGGYYRKHRHTPKHAVRRAEIPQTSLQQRYPAHGEENKRDQCLKPITGAEIRATAEPVHSLAADDRYCDGGKEPVLPAQFPEDQDEKNKDEGSETPAKQFEIRGVGVHVSIRDYVAEPMTWEGIQMGPTDIANIGSETHAIDAGSVGFFVSPFHMRGIPR